MSRERGRTTWIKLYCYGRLHGSMNYQLTEAEQSIWDKFLCLAGLCGMNGLIADNDRNALPHEFIAHEFHTSLDLLESTLTKCKKEGRLSENGSGIQITNWSVYQSEYDRQKVSRDKKKKAPGYQAAADRNAKIHFAIEKRMKELRRDLTPDERQTVIDAVTKGLK